jgi:hypothetical protein
MGEQVCLLCLQAGSLLTLCPAKLPRGLWVIVLPETQSGNTCRGLRSGILGLDLGTRLGQVIFKAALTSCKLASLPSTKTMATVRP